MPWSSYPLGEINTYMNSKKNNASGLRSVNLLFHSNIFVNNMLYVILSYLDYVYFQEHPAFPCCTRTIVLNEKNI